MRGDVSRYAVLISPEDVAELNDVGEGLPALAGWTIVSEMSAADVDQLADATQPILRASVHEFAEGLPTLVLSFRTEAYEFRWVMAMWEDDAQAWLDDALARGEVSMVVNATDVPRCILLKLFTGVLAEAVGPRSLLQPRRVPDGDEHLFCMVDAGLQAACLPAVPLVEPTKAPLRELRMLAVGRGDNAADLHATYSQASQFVLPAAAAGLGPIQQGKLGGAK